MKFEPLTEIEANTYKVITDYLKHNKDMDIQSLLPYCYRTLDRKYSEDSISKAIKALFGKRYFIQGSSLTRDEILHNPTRKQLLQFIQINPGAYNRLIRRELNLGSNEFNWHMGMLEKFGLIKKVAFNDKNFGYFENKTFMGHEYDLYLLQNEKTAKILEYLEKNHATLSQVAKELDMHYSTVQKHLETLSQREFVIMKNEGKHIVFDSNREMIQKMRKIINGQIFIEFAEPLQLK